MPHEPPLLPPALFAPHEANSALVSSVPYDADFPTLNCRLFSNSDTLFPPCWLTSTPLNRCFTSSSTASLLSQPISDSKVDCFSCTELCRMS